MIRIGKRRKRMRSYRKLKMFLLVLSIAGFMLGVMMALVFSVLQRYKIAAVGVVYMAVAIGLYGLRGVIHYYDEQRKRKRNAFQAPPTRMRPT